MANPVLVRFGPFHLDEANARLERAGHAIDLQPKELAVLCELARRPGQLITKDQLLDAVWGHQHVSESVLKTIVSHLRAALDDDAREPRCIETVSRRGYRFVAALGPMEAAAMPPLAAATPASLIGRDAALTRLEAVLQAAMARRRQLMLVAGEAGIGKTTLIDAFTTRAAASGLALARGQCVEHYGAGEPYMPVLEAIDLLVRADAQWLGLLERVAPSWLVQMPWHLEEAKRRELQREVAGTTQERMLREMGELLDRGSERRPLVLVLEDLHWSDHATVHLLGYLARRRTPAALLVLASFRPAEVIAESHPLAQLKHELRAHKLCDEIDLEAFSEADVGAFIEQRLAARAAAPEAFVQALHRHTGGLPLFVVNMLDELGAAQALPAAAGAPFPDAASLSVPSRIADVLALRLARLPREAQRALALASVAGAEFAHLPLAAVGNEEAGDASPAADAARAEALQRLFDAEAARGVWLRATGVQALPGGRLAARYAFRHALYQQVLYQQIPAAERMRWHRALGRALLALHGEAAAELAGELALHFERGALPLEAARQYARVALKALNRSAAHEALLAVRQGLALLPRRAGEAATPTADEAEVIEAELDLRVLEGVASSRIHVLVAPEVAEAFERARSLCARAPASPARARALHGLWWVSFGRGELIEAEGRAMELLDVAATAPSSIGADNLLLVGSSAMGLTLSLRGDFLAARQHLECALAASERIGEGLRAGGMFVQDPEVEARAQLAVLSWWLGEPAAARRHAAESVQRAYAIRHRLSQITALHFSASVHCFAGEMAQARECTGRLFEVIREHGLPAMPGTFSWLHGRAMVAAGEVDEGLAVMRAAEASCRQLGMLIGMTGYFSYLADALVEAGRPGDALESVQRGLALATGGPEKYMLSVLHRQRAGLLAARGDAAAAAEAALATALEVARQQGARFHEFAALVRGLKLGLLRERRAQARARLAELLPAYEAEQIALVREARAWLAGSG